VLQNHQSHLRTSGVLLLGNLLRLLCVPQHLDLHAVSEGLRDEPPVTAILLQQHHRDVHQTLLPGGWFHFLQHQDHERKWGLIYDISLRMRETFVTVYIKYDVMRYPGDLIIFF
jgi:hypothetical protein